MWTDYGISAIDNVTIYSTSSTSSAASKSFTISDSVERTIKEEVKKQLNPEVSKITKNTLDCFSGWIYGNIYEDGFKKGSVAILPDIKEVSIITNKGRECGVEVKFGDNTTEKSIVHKNDTFSLEQGISICVTKKLIALKFGSYKGNESSFYNKLIQYGLKVYEDKKAKEAKEAEEKKRKQEKFEKAVAKKKARKAKRLAKERQDSINIIKAGIVAGFQQLKAEIKVE